MPSFESNVFTEAHEYERNIPTRLTEADITIRDLYIAMLSLKEAPWPAAKMAAKVTHISPEVGRHTLGLTMLDNDMRPEFSLTASSSNGFLSDLDRLRIISISSGEKYEVETGYLQGYDDGMEGEIRAISEGLLLTA